MTPVQARQIAHKLLANALPQRWLHVQAVAATAERIGQCLFTEPDMQTLVAAAWLHDIGYAAPIVETGFHPVDGAQWLRRNGVSARLCALVAHHSCAEIEAEVRGLAASLVPFNNEISLVADALAFADMTAGPAGQPFEVRERIWEIKVRYGEGHPVISFITRAESALLEQAERIQIALLSVGKPL